MSYIQELEKITTPSFEEFLRIATNNLPSDKRSAPWLGLNHGVKLLNSDVELTQYLCAYGKMHKEKIDTVLDSVPNPQDFFLKEMTIIDWGCGQGLATICFFDYMYTLGIMPKIKNIILIEASDVAIKRAELHLEKYVSSDKIKVLNKYINDVDKDDILNTADSVVHFCSNILDIESVDLKHLAQLISNNISVDQIFFCVGPKNLGSSRIKDFAKLFHIEEEDLIKEHSGKLQGRGTIYMLVFSICAKAIEIIKTEYYYQRTGGINDNNLVTKILEDVTPATSSVDKALQFYKLSVELERIKSEKIGATCPYPLYNNSTNKESTKTHIDIQVNPQFKEEFNANRKERWPKHLYVSIAVILENKTYRLLNYIFLYEDIKDLKIETEYLPIKISDLTFDSDVVDQLEISKDVIYELESILSNNDTTFEKLEEVLKDAISNNVVLDTNIHLALTNKDWSLFQTEAELKKLDKTEKDSKPIQENSLLFSFLDGHLPKNQIRNSSIIDQDTIIQIKEMDDSQRSAIASALNNKLTVITGAPGTGKTQMILNLIANAMIRGKSVLMASKNNKAVDNIKERYDEIDALHYLLRFGSKSVNSEQVVPYLGSMVHKIPNIQHCPETNNKLLEEYKSYCEVISDNKKFLSDLSRRKEEQLRIEKSIQTLQESKDEIEKHHALEIENLNIKFDDVFEFSSTDAIDWIKQQILLKMNINIIQSKYHGIKKIWFNWFSKNKISEKLLNNLLTYPIKLRSIIENQSGINCVSDVKDGEGLLHLCKINLIYIEKILDYESERNQLEKELNGNIDNIESELRLKSELREKNKEQIELDAQCVDDRLKGITQNKELIASISVELFKNSIYKQLKSDKATPAITKYKNSLEGYISEDSVPDFIDIFRLNSVTNLSIKRSYPLINEIFDIVIIDEASQCDVASALPLIYRAKQLVVIGDPLQLKHITPIKHEEENQIKEKLSIQENSQIKHVDFSLWDYSKDIITSTDSNNRPIVLDSHYRCHPQIINYSNKMFYEKHLGITLNVKTKEKHPLVKQKGIIWEDVKGFQRKDTQNINDAEVTKCVEIATRLANEYPTISIGIISPFKHQIQEINSKISHLNKNQIIADTVHKFQGDEKDVIIYSLVITENSPESKIKWIDRSVPNLVNVAVTRARTALYVVGNRDYIKKYSSSKLPLGGLVEYIENNSIVTTNVENRTYVIDTNIFIDCGDIIEWINPIDYIVIPFKVIEELDKLKISSDETIKIKAEQAIRKINYNLGKRKIRQEASDLNYLPIDFNKKNPDNMILSVAVKYRNQNPILLTSDNGLQIKAKGLNIKTESFRTFKDRV